VCDPTDTSVRMCGVVAVAVGWEWPWISRCEVLILVFACFARLVRILMFGLDWPGIYQFGNFLILPCEWMELLQL
jgi:hypothetical protein